MEIDTPAIRRLRDRLLGGEPPPHHPDDGALPWEGLSEAQQAVLDRIAPLAEVLVLTMAADDQLADLESQAVGTAIHALADDLLPPATVGRLLRFLTEQSAAQGPEARLEALSSRFSMNRVDAEAAFNLAAAVALSDGAVDQAERALIGKLRSYFGISAQRAAALLDGAPTAR